MGLPLSWWDYIMRIIEDTRVADFLPKSRHIFGRSAKSASDGSPLFLQSKSRNLVRLKTLGGASCLRVHRVREAALGGFLTATFLFLGGVRGHWG